MGRWDLSTILQKTGSNSFNRTCALGRITSCVVFTQYSKPSIPSNFVHTQMGLGKWVGNTSDPPKPLTLHAHTIATWFHVFKTGTSVCWMEGVVWIRPLSWCCQQFSVLTETQQINITKLQEIENNHQQSPTSESVGPTILHHPRNLVIFFKVIQVMALISPWPQDLLQSFTSL